MAITPMNAKQELGVILTDFDVAKESLLAAETLIENWGSGESTGMLKRSLQHATEKLTQVVARLGQLIKKVD